jgi:hypothetical protein
MATVVLNQTTAPAKGAPIEGYLELDNRTGAPITITNACNGWFGIGLTNERIQRYTPGFGQVACASETLPVGTTRKPLQIRTTYAECVEPGGSAGGTPSVPSCIGAAHTTPPNLPAGVYVTSIAFQGFAQQPTVTPVVVTLTSS